MNKEKLLKWIGWIIVVLTALSEFISKLPGDVW